MNRLARCVSALGMLMIASAACAQPAAESVTSVDASAMVDCRFASPPRYVGLGQYRSFDNYVQRLSKAECDIRVGASGFASSDEVRAPLAGWTDLATRGDAAAQNRMGQMYELGIDTPPDPAVAGQWYAKAAANGNQSAAANLASLYERGILRKPDAASAKPNQQPAVAPAGPKATNKIE